MKIGFVGYFGWGNFGDELLLEIVLNELQKNNVSIASFRYSNPAIYYEFHKKFKYPFTRSNWEFIKKIFQSKSVLIGGGRAVGSRC